jgi:hypothetical protein
MEARHTSRIEATEIRAECNVRQSSRAYNLCSLAKPPTRRLPGSANELSVARQSAGWSTPTSVRSNHDDLTMSQLDDSN